MGVNYENSDNQKEKEKKIILLIIETHGSYKT